MKYTCSTEINLPIEKVVELWKDENNFHKWQDGFKSIEFISGKAGEEGAESKILLEQGNRKIELKETITINNLPEERTALYEHIHMSNIQTSKFKVLDDNTTQYISKVEYLKFNGFMPKLMARLFPRMFKKQSQKWMNQFKAFAEGNNV